MSILYMVHDESEDYEVKLFLKVQREYLKTCSCCVATRVQVYSIHCIKLNPSMRFTTSCFITLSLGKLYPSMKFTTSCFIALSLGKLLLHHAGLSHNDVKG